MGYPEVCQNTERTFIKAPSGAALERQRDLLWQVEAAEVPAEAIAEAVSPYKGVAVRPGVEQPRDSPGYQ